ncbi:MAG: hypothetical protein ABI082_03710 [Dokdonella sp.]
MTRSSSRCTIVGLVLTACAFVGMSAVRADPPTAANTDSATPSIATVTLQPVAPSENGAAQPLDPGPGIRFEDLPNDVGLRVRVLTRNQRVHLGIVKRADARHVTLSVKQYGGSATYVLARDQIERIDPA